MLTHLDSFCNFLLLYTLAPFSLHYFPTRRSSDLQVEVTEALNIEAVYSLQPGSLTVNNYVTIGSDWAPVVFTVHVLNRVSGELVESGEVAPNEPIQFERVPVGAYDVEFAGISGSNCVTVPNPQTAVISAGEETEVDFNISCGPGGEME